MLTHALLQEFDARFRYRPVAVLPPATAVRQQAAAIILRIARGARDLSKGQEGRILQADNGDWTSYYIHHFCVPGCSLGCDGSEAKAKRIVRSEVVLSVDGQMVVPLLYRWKGFEAANAKYLRGRRQHQLLDAAFSARLSIERGLDHRSRVSVGQTGICF